MSIEFVDYLGWQNVQGHDALERNLRGEVDKFWNLGADVVLVDYYKDNCPSCTMLTKSLETVGTRLTLRIIVLKVKMEDVGVSFFTSKGLRSVPVLEYNELPGFTETLSGYLAPGPLAEWIEGLAK